VTLTVNGVDISTLAYNVSDMTGRWTTPPKRGKDIDVPNRHGVVKTPNKKFSSGTVVFPMWVVGANPDGTIPSDTTSRKLIRSNIDLLTRIFCRDSVTIDFTASDGSVRRIIGQVLDAIDPTAQAGATRAEFSVSIVVHSAFWEDVEVVTSSKTGTGSWSVTEFGGATAPMDDLEVSFTGPATNPRLTNPFGVYVSYNAALTGSQTVKINCATWSPTGINITPSYSAVGHGGDPRWFVLEPGDPIPSVTASQTAGSTGVFGLAGKRKYLISG
jgi:hypothetical protein